MLGFLCDSVWLPKLLLFIILFFNRAIEIPEDETEKKLCFQKFLRESQEAFKKYKVVYLFGIRTPQDFCDLLPVPETSFKDVVWLNNLRPRSNQFAVVKSLNPEQQESLSLEIHTELQTIVMYYSWEVMSDIS